MAKASYKQILDAAVQTDADMKGALSEGMMTIADGIRHAPDLVAFFRNPSVSEEDKRSALEKAFADAPAAARNVTLLLIRNGYFSDLDEAAVHVHAAGLERAGKKSVRVRTAFPLSEDQLERMKQVITPVVGREPVIDMEVDPQLIGGVHIAFGDQEYDSSIAGRLEQLKQRILAID